MPSSSPPRGAKPRSSFFTRLRRRALRVDSWIDSALYRLGRAGVSGWEKLYLFSSRFRVRGWRRLGVELAGEGLTLGLGGAILALALAAPAFKITAGGDWLSRADIAVTFLDRYGNLIGQRGIMHDNAVPLSEMPDYVIKAVLATEDRRFYEHFGIDIIGTARAIVANAEANDLVQGGSSLSQQLAKNLFLSNERTLQRKIREAYLALWLETQLTKDEILKLYLDRAYMGGGAFGIEAAAQFYFGKSVRDVSLAEAALLAGLFKAPTRYAPHVNLAAARARANQVLSNMVEAGFLTEGQVYGARREPAEPIDRSGAQMPDYYLDWAYQQIVKMSAEGKLGSETVFVVKTAHDPAIQKAAENALETTLRQYGKSYNAHQGAIVVMEPDGAVRAMVGGRDYGQSQFNRATDALRQPGSSFKPFVYTTALMNGFKPQSVVVDAPICIKNWCPQNYAHSYSGSVTFTTALVKSINTIPVRLSLAMGKGNGAEGRRKIVETAHKMGIETPIRAESWALPIGVEAVNLLEMTGAFGVFASGGRKAPPHAALEVLNSKGELLYRFNADRENPVVLDQKIIEQMNVILNKVVEEGTGRRAQLAGIKAGGKTGTTNAYRDAWFMGFTGNLVAGVWFGNDNYRPTNRMTGGSLPAMTWNMVMAAAHQNLAIRPIPGVEPFPAEEPATTPVAAAEGPGSDVQALWRSGNLSPAETTALKAIETLIEKALPSEMSSGTVSKDQTLFLPPSPAIN